MKLLDILPNVLKTVTSVLGINVQPVLDALTGMSPEKQAELEQAMANHDLEMAKLDVDVLKSVVSESIAATQSEDSYVRRARPTGLYIAYLVTLIVVIGMLCKLVDSTTWPLIGEIMLPLYGNAAYYTYNRTKEKVSGA